MNGLIVFDCDGTLVDSQGAIISAVRSAFALAGLPVPEDEAIRRIVGLSVPEAMQKLLPGLKPDDIPPLVTRFRAAFLEYRAQHGVALEPLYPGIRETLLALDAQGYGLAVATGKSRRGLEATLGHHDLLDLFIALETSDGHPSKPHPAMLEAAMAAGGAAPHETLVIGDTSYDMLMANAAGARGIGVAWGYHPAADLVEAGAAAIVAHAGDLVDTIATTLERTEP